MPPRHRGPGFGGPRPPRRGGPGFGGQRPPMRGGPGFCGPRRPMHGGFGFGRPGMGPPPPPPPRRFGGRWAMPFGCLGCTLPMLLMAAGVIAVSLLIAGIII